MAVEGKALPAISKPSALDEAGEFLWNFLKTELTPYPGRAWVVARITIAATLVMILVMTFQIPSGFLGAIFTLFLSRENPSATLVSGLRAIAGFVGATV
jgi:multidrug resistance protein MdtO